MPEAVDCMGGRASRGGPGWCHHGYCRLGPARTLMGPQGTMQGSQEYRQGELVAMGGWCPVGGAQWVVWVLVCLWHGWFCPGRGCVKEVHNSMVVALVVWLICH